MFENHYLRKTKVVLFLILVCSLCCYGCSGILGSGDDASGELRHIEPSTVASTTHHIEPVVPETTSTLNLKLANVSANVTHGTDTITISSATNAALANASEYNIEAGQILAGGVSGATPNGYLKRVKAVRHENGNIILDIENAALQDAIQNSHFSFSHPVKRNQIVSFAPAMAGVKLNDTEFFNDNVTLDVNVVVYDEDGDLKTTNDQIKASGKLNLLISLDGDLKIDWYTLTQFKLYAKVKEGLNLSISSAKALKAKKTIPLGEFAITPITIMIGPVPLVVIPKIKVNLNFEGNLTVSVSLGLDQSLSFAMGFEYLNGKTSPYGEGPVFSVTPYQSIALGGSAEVSIGPELEASIYGLGGPSIEADVYFSAEAEIKETNVSLSSEIDLQVGLRGTVSGEIDALKNVLGKLEFKIFDIAFWKKTIPLLDVPVASPRDLLKRL